MAESQMNLQCPHEMIVKIFQLAKGIYEKEPSAETQHMIRQVFLQLQNQIAIDETRFGQLVLKMIDQYLYLCEEVGNPNNLNHQQKLRLKVECPNFMQIHEALQHSHYYTSLIMRPTTSSATLSRQDTVLKGTMAGSTDNNSADRPQHSQSSTLRGFQTETKSNQSTAEVLEPTMQPCQQPQTTQQCRGPIFWSADQQITIARSMKSYFIQNPAASRFQMLEVLHTYICPHVDFNSFEGYVDRMILNYLSVRSEVDDPNINHGDKVRRMLSCPYYYEMQEALQHSEQYRRII